MILDHLPEGLIQLDAFNRCQLINLAGERLLAQPRGELLGKELLGLELDPRSSSWEDQLARTRLTGQPRELVCCVKTPAGVARLEARLSLLGEEKLSAGVLVTLRPATQESGTQEILARGRLLGKAFDSGIIGIGFWD
ncbi:MAG: PAS domain-containing protein, partial [Myxococcaceae bacterium]